MHTKTGKIVAGNRQRRGMAVLLAVFLLALALTGCAGSNSNTSKDESFNLAGLSNPFIGEWQSEIPSADATLTFDFKADGTFDYEMAGVPEDQGGKGSGGYVIYGDIQVTWLDYEGAAAYNFKVVDNDTINVTELEPDDTGKLVPGDTAPFTRVKGSEVNKKDIPFKLDNAFIGKWKSEIPSVNTTLTFDFKADGTFDFEMAGVPEDQGGKGVGCYIVIGDKQVSYLDFEGVASYSFKIVDDNTIDMTELELNENGELVPGNTSPFVRVTGDEVDYHSLAAWEGAWNSMVAYLDGEAAEVFEGDDEKKAGYEAGVYTDFLSCVIEGDTMKLYDRKQTASSPQDAPAISIKYTYIKEISQTVEGFGTFSWYAFEGDQAGPYQYLIALPAEDEDGLVHFHARWGRDGFDPLLEAESLPIMVKLDTEISLIKEEIVGSIQ
ncbi:metal-binding protein ZinT [Lachnospiraceae bacterium ZAX-1]